MLHVLLDAAPTATAFPMPQTYGEGFLIVSLLGVTGYLVKVLRENNALRDRRAERAEEQVDKLTGTLPDIARSLSELLELKNERPPARRS